MTSGFQPKQRSPPPPLAQAARAMALPLLLSLLLLGPGLAAAAEVPSGQPSLVPETSLQQFGTVSAGNAEVYRNIQPPAGTNPAILVTLTPTGDGSGDVDLYCSPDGGAVPGPEYADFKSEAIGVNQDVVFIPPVDGAVPESPPVYICVVYNPGLTFAPVSYKLSVAFEYNSTSLGEGERAVAQQLYDRCCQSEVACLQWKMASEKAAAAAEEEAQAAGAPAPAAGMVDTDLCQFGVCNAGFLTQLNARGWFMSCPFPGDLLAQFTQLEGLYLSYNSLTGDVGEAARNLSSLANLQELGLYNNQLTGSLSDSADVCTLVQGTVEMLQLGGQGITGSLPSCLFDGNSTLYQFAAANNQLTGSLPDAFATATRLQVLNLAANQLSGAIPATLAAAPSLVILELSNNSISGSLPDFVSSRLSAVSLPFNKLTGALPEGLAGHPALLSLDVHANQLTSLPKQWEEAAVDGVAAPLNYLRASMNQLEGSFPAALATYPNLTYLLIDDNKLSGDLPDPAAGQYALLRYLSAANNSFSGALGEGWQGTGIFQLPLLAVSSDYWNLFSVAGNQLTGDVPAYLKDSNQKVNILLEGNQFSTSTEQAAAAGTAGGGGGGLSSGAVAGIVVGTLLALVVAAAGGVWLMKRQKSRGPQTAASNLKFDRFLDDEAQAAASPQPHFSPAPFYETLPAPTSPSAPPAGGARRVELSGSGAFNAV